MKKYIKLLVIGISLLVVLAGCQSLTNNNEPGVVTAQEPGNSKPETNEVANNDSNEDVAEGEENPITQESNVEEESIVVSRAIEQYPISLYDQTEFDLDQDGENEIIEMYVNAEKYNGEYAWDDGQNWLLVVKDGEDTYPLYDGWVQLASLKFWLMQNDGVPTLVLLHSGGAVFHLQTFTYSEEKGGYVQKTHFNPENINLFFHSN